MTEDYNAFSRRSGIIVIGVLRIYNTDSCYLRKLRPAKERKKQCQTSVAARRCIITKNVKGLPRWFGMFFAAKWNTILFDAFLTAKTDNKIMHMINNSCSSTSMEIFISIDTLALPNGYYHLKE